MKKFIFLTIVCFLTMAMVSMSLAADSVKMEWTPNSESDLVGYYMYRTQVSGDYNNFGGETCLNWVGTINCAPNDATCCTFTDFVYDYNTTYFWVVTAFDTETFESGPSNEVSYATNDAPWIGIAPGSPQGLGIVEVIQNVEP